ncbi:MAG TPA: hypothetical protein VM661_06720 [Candidatus Sulfotelmatobacter sp.]|jgi:hypothetical protein|nr:hypothetical protein [Candidatus Sulfotelmatobacter sp.]
MTRTFSSLLILCLALSLPAQAAKPKTCFSKAEMNAERLVRQGLRLREGAKGCDGDPWNFQTQAQWEDIDKRFGPQFAAQTKIRRGAFVREFDKEADYRINESDGRIVMLYRGYPLSAPYCTEIKKLLTDMQKSGWVAFTKKANTAPDEVKFVYRACN